MICNLTNKNSNQSKPMLKKRKLSRFIRNKEKFVLFKKFKKRRAQEIGKNKEQKPSKNHENLRNGPIKIYHSFLQKENACSRDLLKKIKPGC